MNAPSSSRIALITGGNRGIGWEIANQFARKSFRIVLTARDEAKGRKAAQTLSDAGAQATYLSSFAIVTGQQRSQADLRLSLTAD